MGKKKKKIAAAQLATISAARWTGNKLFLSVASCSAESDMEREMWSGPFKRLSYTCILLVGDSGTIPNAGHMDNNGIQAY